jgi:ADP-ribosylglycohydrolase
MTGTTYHTHRDRILGCFKGLAVGDAIGKQTETLSSADVRKWYPGGITGFEGAPGDVIPRYKGKRYEWRIGETTDDTEQTLAVARAVLREGAVNHEAIGRELLHCKKSLHPGVSLWDFVQAGDPARVATQGDGCGAAMRVAPVGVLYRSDQLDDLVRAAHECAIPTHGGPLAISAAAAVAGAVSAAIDGKPASEVLAVALEACRMETMARWIENIYKDLLQGLESAEQYFPDSPQTKVPLAICLALVTESAEQTALIAANLGGDSDSVASIGGAIAGALRPESVNERWFQVVSAINGDELLSLASALTGRR